MLTTPGLLQVLQLVFLALYQEYICVRQMHINNCPKDEESVLIRKYQAIGCTERKKDEDW